MKGKKFHVAQHAGSIVDILERRGILGRAKATRSAREILLDVQRRRLVRKITQ